MRAWILSDLHLDANRDSPFLLPHSRPNHDVVLIAGDICQDLSRGVSCQGLNETPVIYVPGNHEYYGFDFETERTAWCCKAQWPRNIHVLDRDAVTLDGIRFLGATLWTDYCLFGEGVAQAAMQRAEATMNDHRMIRSKGRRWTATDAAAEHRHSRKWFEEQLAVRDGARAVVVTHTAPSIRSIAARYKDDLVTAGFASDLEHLVGGARLWVHGHTHVGSDYWLEGCHVVNNPRGYIAHGEGETFDPNLICEL